MLNSTLSISSSHRRSLCATLLVLVAFSFFLFQSPSYRFPSPYTQTFKQAPPTTLLYSENGLVTFKTPVHSGTRNPIIQLIENAKSKWEITLKRQSQNLTMAVREYQKRHHGRPPPKGFDKWWKFAKEHQVILVDEYDQISLDLEPFWAIEPDRLRKLVDEVEIKDAARKIVFEFMKDGTIKRKGPLGDTSRAKDLSNLIESLKDYSRDLLEGVKMVISKDDQAEVKITWREKAKLVELGRRGQFIDAKEHMRLSQTLSPSDGCPPGSSPNNLSEGYQSLIYDHLESMKLCSNMEQVPLHGSLSRGPPAFRSIVPLFCLSKTSADSDIRVTPLEQYHPVYPGPVYHWNDTRRIEKAFWRGHTTGTHHSDSNPGWKNSHRIRLTSMTKPTNETKRLIDGEVINLNDANPKLFDVGYAGTPIQCDPPVCDELKKMFRFSGFINSETANLYKYVLDVDGNGWSGRFHKLLLSNRVTIKTTVFPEWYADRIQPWHHYIPSKIDYSDLHDIVYFLKTHDDLAEQIASNAQDWAKAHWRKEDMAAYMFRLMLEWSRLTNRKTCTPGTGHECESFDFDLRLLESGI